MSKTIAVHPDLFNFSGRNSRKKRTDTSNAPIKVRSPKEKQKTFRKNHVLRFIREEQEKNYKKMMGQETKSSPEPAKHDREHQENDQFNSSFDESLKYLSQLSKENEEKTVQHNRTLRQNGHMDKDFSSFSNVSSLDNIAATLPAINASSMNNVTSMHLAPPVHTVPSWGCLKNGSLPTFRTWRNVTQKNVHGPPIMASQLSPIIENTFNDSTNTIQPSSPMLVSPTKEREILAKEMMRNSDTAKTMSGGKNNVKRPKMRYPKQQRTVRRTHKVGKSKVHPRVSVLISNRTIRNNITTKTQLLKQTPIDEVKRYLVKKGFIRVGSSCPNDVLRKMHETAQLMCGEIQNHNPDNLLYNFLHDVQK